MNGGKQRRGGKKKKKRKVKIASKQNLCETKDYS